MDLPTPRAISFAMDHAEPLEMLRELGGFYTCPKDQDGNRLGPLVGYAGTYATADGTHKHWVGEVYANFAKLDESPNRLFYLAHRIKKRGESSLDFAHVFCGAPIGGYSFSQMLGLAYDCRVIKAEKRVVALTPIESIVGAREQSSLVFARHKVKPGEDVVIVEDVCNNFSTTEQLITLIEQSGGTVVAITCLLNRSLTIDTVYTSHGKEIPVISLVRLPIREYQQDDPEVVKDIAQGNVVWKPKNEWRRLMTAMKHGTKKT